MAPTNVVNPATGDNGEDDRNCDDGSNKKQPLQSKEQPFPFRRLLAYADGVDWLLMALGALGSVVHGMAQPIGYLLLGKALDAFGTNINDDDKTVEALNKVMQDHFSAQNAQCCCFMFVDRLQS